VEIHVAASQRPGPHVTRGTQATLSAGGARAQAEVRGIVPALDARTRTLRLRLEPSAPTPWLTPGMTLDVIFAVVRGGDDEPRLIVSRDALVRGPGGVRVMKVVDEQAVMAPVEVVATVDDDALVRSPGLAAGDRVVVRGNERLRPGQAVREVPSEPKLPATPSPAGPEPGAGAR
jgi:multidrug efflux pump subunit AcrA (membrane-fusion protein)